MAYRWPVRGAETLKPSRTCRLEGIPILLEGDFFVPSVTYGVALRLRRANRALGSFLQIVPETVDSLGTFVHYHLRALRSPPSYHSSRGGGRDATLPPFLALALVKCSGMRNGFSGLILALG